MVIKLGAVVASTRVDQLKRPSRGQGEARFLSILSLKRPLWEACQELGEVKVGVR